MCLNILIELLVPCDLHVYASTASMPVKTGIIENGILYYEGHKYQYFEGGISWYQAESKCEELGGHLVVITSKEEQENLNDYVKELQKQGQLTKQDIWIGANIKDKKITWVTQEKCDYTNWNAGEPNNVFSIQDCVMMYTPLSVNGALGYWNDENGNGRDWSGYNLWQIGYICEWDSIPDGSLSIQDGVVIEMKQYIKNMPKLSEEDARLFLAFIYNDSNYEKLDLTNDDTYNMLIGNIDTTTLSLEELKARMWALSAFTRTAMNQYVDASAEDVKYLSDELVIYLQKELNGMRGMDEEIISETTGKMLGYVKDGVKGLFSNVLAETTGVVLTEDTFESAQSIIDTCQDVNSFKSSVDTYVSRVVAGVQASFLPIKSEALGRYSYFLAYINDRKTVESSEDDIFKAMMEYNFLAAKENSYWSGLLDLTTWINGKDAWYNHRDMIDGWAEYFYNMEQYINTDSHFYEKTVVAPTCTMKGYTQYTCVYCRNSFWTDETETIPHAYEPEWTTDRAPTCEKEGEKSRRCTYCGQREKKTIEALEHEIELIEEENPSCTEKGHHLYYYCTVCGKYFADAQAKKETTVEAEEIAPLGHSGGKADCLHKAICQRCGEEYGEVNQDVHGETELRNQKDATCIAEGYTGYIYCKDCGARLTLGKEIARLDHHYISSIIKEPTTEGNGIKKYICEICGDTYTEEIPRIDNTKLPNTGNDTGTENVTNDEGKSVQIITTAVADVLTKSLEDIGFSLGAITDGDGILSYVSDNESVVKVDDIGNVTVVGIGTAHITITASETLSCDAASKVITVIVRQEKQNITAKNITKTYGASPFYIGAKANGGAKLTYSIQNKKIATIDKKGKVTIKGCGRTQIKIKASENDNYSTASKTVILTVKPQKVVVTSLKSSKKKSMMVKWKKVSKVSGYIVEYSTDKKFKKNVKAVDISKKSRTSKTISKIKEGKIYYVRVCAYAKSDGKKIKGNYSNVKKIKVKK